MGGYDIYSGDFMNYEYVHVTAVKTETTPIITCQCKIFSTLQASIDVDHGHYANARERVTCCHCRLMKELMIFVDFDGLNESAIIPEHINKQIVLEALECTNDQVISLPAKTGVKRFSIVADQVEFVTVCNVDKTHKQIATCHSTQCRLSKNQSTKRNVRNLTDCSSLCQHLKLLKESFDEVPTRMEMDIEVDDGNYGDSSDEDDTLPSEKWEDIFDVACGLWTFGKNCPSTQIVDSNPDSNNLSIQFYQRSRIDIKEPEAFPLFVPSANGTCTCQVNVSTI
ncbi:uncharacterized protein LOC130657823 [Hydractinia symbiolongicarpus]|uniref:uncharacterized protein LOC130657823 n=1 Tax=Hydractinia symbiolongicarpus TaxID=13093 RepID=UPI002550CB24|nr:uncharacterized protein LOC130657823 [Hydractinia symbiolongicarpus]